MIAEAARRLLCRAGRHHVVRCAGAPDHAWTWDGAADRWTAVLVPVPAGKLTPVTPGRGEPTTPGSEEPVAPDPDPVEVDPEPVTGSAMFCTLDCTTAKCSGVCPGRVAAVEKAFYGRADELIARGDVDGYLRLLRDTDLVAAGQGVRAVRPPAGKNDLVGRGAHRAARRG